MPTERADGGDSRTWAKAAALAGLTLVVGLYLLLSMPLIERDGVTFIEYAKGLDIDARATVMDQDQHPGYPVMIWLAHKAARVMGFGESLMLWVYSAQGAALLFRVAAAIPLYFLGRRLVGDRAAFIACVLIAVLPGMAQYGSDALSDWPCAFFFAWGVLALVKAAVDGPLWLFAIAGFLTGLGYLVRPECAVVVVAGFIWAGRLALSPKERSQKTAVLAAVLLLLGFLVPAAPYMAAKGAIFPKKHVGEFALRVDATSSADSHPVMAGGMAPGQATAFFVGVGKLVTRAGEVLSWYFLPFMVIGAILWFRGRAAAPAARFIVGTLLFVCAGMAIWLFVRHGYLSRRHILGMMLAAVFFVPVGIEAVAAWCSGKGGVSVRQVWGAGLLIAGVAICLVRLWGLADTGKRGYIEAAMWLRDNTVKDDVVAAPDKRIAFYAERRWRPCSNDAGNVSADYVVRTGAGLQAGEEAGQPLFRFDGRLRSELSVMIYKGHSGRE